ncbi:MAG TPA: hypothetical protein VGR37_23670, partial [Longimicrobiaceae bacterium]|nr:hypothetical protein [Longimicrobiaceae bacterium]
PTLRVGYVCEGGGALGWGHVGRGRALLEEAPEGSALVLGAGYGEIAAWSRRTGVPLPLRPWEAPDAPFDPRRCGFDVLVVDHYRLDAAWIAEASAALPTFVVDDWMRGRVAATGLVAPNVGASPADWPGSEVDVWLAGPEYAFLRREVRSARGAPVRGRAERVLVTLGGSDPEGRTAEIVEALVELPWYRGGGALTVVLGASYAAPRPWEGWGAARTVRLDVVQQPADFVARCAAADLVVCGASTTTYELAHLGRPFVPVALVDNQARITAEWARLGVGDGLAVWNPGWREALAADVERLAGDAASRARRSAAASCVVDGRGIFRVLEACAAAVRRWAGA